MMSSGTLSCLRKSTCFALGGPALRHGLASGRLRSSFSSASMLSSAAAAGTAGRLLASGSAFAGVGGVTAGGFCAAAAIVHARAALGGDSGFTTHSDRLDPTSMTLLPTARDGGTVAGAHGEVGIAGSPLPA
jgi:hypothetical protein